MFDLIFKSTVETKEPYIYDIYMEGDEDSFLQMLGVGEFKKQSFFVEVMNGWSLRYISRPLSSDIW